MQEYFGYGNGRGLEQWRSIECTVTVIGAADAVGTAQALKRRLVRRGLDELGETWIPVETMCQFRRNQAIEPATRGGLWRPGYSAAVPKLGAFSRSSTSASGPSVGSMVR